MSINVHLRRLVVLLAIAGVWATPGRAAPQTTARPATEGPETHLGRGYDALKDDRYDLAVSEFRAALALDPTLVLRARFPLAVALFELHKNDEARREFDAVRREAGDHPNISYYLGRLDINDRNFPSAIQNLTKAIEKPPFPDTAYYLGFSYFKQGDLAQAEKCLKEAAKLNPHDSRVPYQLGFVYRKQGREEEAQKALALSEDLHHREDSESQLRLGCAQKLDQGLRDEAHALCDQLYDPNNAERLTALGTIYGQHGDLEAALKPLRRAAELAPQSPQMQYNLALAYFQLNRFEDARAPLATALRRWPDLFQLNALYGAVLLQLGDDASAYKTLQHAQQLNPQEKETADLLYAATLSLAAKTKEGGQYPEAIHYLEEAAKLRSQDPEPHQRLSELYRRSGRLTEAKAESAEAERLANLRGPSQ